MQPGAPTAASGCMKLHLKTIHWDTFQPGPLKANACCQSSS